MKDVEIIDRAVPKSIQDAIEQGQAASQEADKFASNLGLDACAEAS